jgi:hypothetical protein
MSDVFAGKCDNTPVPQVEIEISKSEIKEAYDITAADLQRLAETTGRRPSWPGLGASSSDIAYAAEISEDAEKGAGWLLLRDPGLCPRGNRTQKPGRSSGSGT